MFSLFLWPFIWTKTKGRRGKLIRTFPDYLVPHSPKFFCKEVTKRSSREREREREREEMKGGEGKMDRKTVEKHRRMHMKNLCFKLASLIPKQEYISKVAVSQHDHLDQAAAYIQKLRERIENLSQTKEDKRNRGEVDNTTNLGVKLPMIEVRHHEPNLEILLISGLEKTFKFYEVIGILEEEGAEVVNASFSIVGDKIFYTIHSQAICSRIGLEESRVTERLQQLMG